MTIAELIDAYFDIFDFDAPIKWFFDIFNLLGIDIYNDNIRFDKEKGCTFYEMD